MVLDADRIRLEQALANLVDNALLHGEGNIELNAWQDTTATHLAVSDTGPGFGDRTGATTFARFQRGNSPRSGSGLAMVRTITRAHGGTVTARSEDTTRITITIPH
jgi:signal transduction histidine kinase